MLMMMGMATLSMMVIAMTVILFIDASEQPDDGVDQIVMEKMR